MDFARPYQSSGALHPAVRNAFEALAAALAITLATTFAVNWVLQNFGYSSEMVDALREAQRWFLPMFAYLWGMFWMIDTGQNMRLSRSPHA